MGGGSVFSDGDISKAVVKVGENGSSGIVEITESCSRQGWPGGF